MEFDITILYGSQTGNAEDLSKRIGAMAKLHGYTVMVKQMDDFPIKKLTQGGFILFVCSTTGHGQEPENMRNLFNFMRLRDLPKGCLSNLRFAVYGLGDSSYAKFNYVAKILFKRLKDCGAQPVQELVAGDEQNISGCDGVIYPKLQELWNKLDELLPNRQICIGGTESYALESSYEVIVHEQDLCSAKTLFKEEYLHDHGLLVGHCIFNNRITPPDHFQDTRHIGIKTDKQLDFEPGDVCVILPANSDDNVQQFIRALKLNPTTKFSIKKRNRHFMVNYLYDFIPDGTTTKDLVKYYLDIQSVPRRSFFEFLWQFSSNSLERDKLKEFASTEGQEEMYEYCTQPKRSIMEVLLDFPDTLNNIKFEFLLDIIPPIKPRSFSIASSSKVYPHEVHLLVGVVNYQTRLRKRRLGLCSNYLASIKPTNSCLNRENSEVRFSIRRTSFKLPKDPDAPVIMIGPGLGISPFRSFIQELKLRENRLANCLLYFGCRYHKADFYFQKELEEACAEGLKLRVAFSRESERYYVQDLITADSELLTNLVEQGAVIYVAGNSKLPEDLRILFAKLLVKNDDHPNFKGEEIVAQLEAKNRILYDCW